MIGTLNVGPNLDLDLRPKVDLDLDQNQDVEWCCEPTGFRSWVEFSKKLHTKNLVLLPCLLLLESWAYYHTESPAILEASIERAIFFL